MNLENPTELVAYLRDRSCLFAGERVDIQALSGGVSCHTLLVRRTGRPDLVIKQALPRLKVREAWFSDPSRIHIEAAAMRVLQELTPFGSVPRLLFEDFDEHLLAMEAVPQPHDNWKALLLSGRVDPDHFRQFAVLLGGIHRRSLGREKYALSFADRRFFEALRLEPYYAFSAGQVPGSAPFLHRLITDCRKVRLTLVHGDFSPKNVLVFQGRLILLDHEVMHYGDGAFDIGFSMTHFLSKARHVAACRSAFLEAALQYWNSYRAHFLPERDWEERAVRHTVACLLARVCGKSPLEYLSEAERAGQQALCLRLIRKLPGQMTDLIGELEKVLGKNQAT